MVFLVAACADQAELINKSLVPNKTYRVYDLLPGGENDLVMPESLIAFGNGNPDSLCSIIINPDLFKVINRILLKGKYIFDSVVHFLNMR